MGWINRTQSYQVSHPDESSSSCLRVISPKNRQLRNCVGMLSALSGKYFQQHQPIRKQNVPVGHSVRFAYLQTAAAMLERITRRRPTWQPWKNPGNAWSSIACTSPAGSVHCPKWKALAGMMNSILNLPMRKPVRHWAASSGIGRWHRSPAKPNTATCWNGSYIMQRLVGMGLNGQCYLYNNPLASHRWGDTQSLVCRSLLPFQPLPHLGRPDEICPLCR